MLCTINYIIVPLFITVNMISNTHAPTVSRLLIFRKTINNNIMLLLMFLIFIISKKLNITYANE